MPIVNNVIYREGARVAEPPTLEATYETLRDHAGMAWIGLYRPTPAEIRSVADEFDLHALAIEDTVKAHQRPKLERYDDDLFIVLRPARYVDADESVEFGELHVFLSEDIVVTVRHAEAPDLSSVRRRLERRPDLLKLGPEAVLYAVMDQVVDDYAPVVAGLQNDIDEIENQVFEGDPAVSRRIYELTREVIEFQRATVPLIDILNGLTAGFEKYHVDLELQHYLRDVHDHALRVREQVEGFRTLLQNILTVNATLVAQRQNEDTQRLSEASIAQNEEVKRISAWAAILFAPTLVGTIYGMNFAVMPELDLRWGYPFALLLMGCVSGSLYVVFRRRGWL
jgi:magnesium transporter